MNDLFLLSQEQMARISPCFPHSHSMARVDDRRIISGIVYVIKHGLQWKDAPVSHRPHKTCITASSAEEAWECLTASFPPLQDKDQSRNVL